LLRAVVAPEQQSSQCVIGLQLNFLIPSVAIWRPVGPVGAGDRRITVFT